MKKAVIFDLVGVLVEPQESMKVKREVFDFARSLKERYRLGILSNLSAEYVKDLKNEGFYEVFSEIHLSGETGLEKPGREAYLLILQKLGVIPQEALFIDDSPRNIEGARDIGMTVILYKDYQDLIEKFEEKENPLV